MIRKIWLRFTYDFGIFDGTVLTATYLRGDCACREMLRRRNGRGQAPRTCTPASGTPVRRPLRPFRRPLWLRFT
eukprot:COSAG01_NODE_3761_length_5722_cov_2.962298_4_plen_74_part_00